MPKDITAPAPAAAPTAPATDTKPEAPVVPAAPAPGNPGALEVKPPAAPEAKPAPAPAGNDGKKQSPPADGDIALSWQDDTEKDGKKETAAEGEKKPEDVDDYQFTPPEGYVEDAETIGEFKEIMKSSGIDRETAKKIYDLGPKLGASFANSLMAKATERSTKWGEELRGDAVYGGANYPRSVEDARRGMEHYAPAVAADFRTDDFKLLGNWPNLFRHFAELGKGIREASSPKTEPPRSSGPSTLAQQKKVMLEREKSLGYTGMET